MALKIYSKRGVPNYKEKRLVRKLEEALKKKVEENPTFEENFRPATNLEELQALHDKYCVEEVPFEEVEDKDEQHKQFRDSIKEGIEDDKDDKDDKDDEDVVIKEDTKKDKKISNNDLGDDDAKFVDPFNRDTTIVRDYVMNDGFKEDDGNKEPKKTSFDEPQSFGESFQMPGSDIGADKQEGPAKKKDKTKEQPFNPSYDDMSNGRKKRSTKKFAKYIVEGVCMLAEKGFVWWTTKNITEEKLAEYELSGEYDFNVLLTLETGQEVYVKQWFKQQRLTAEALSKFDKEEKEDLAEVLAEVLSDKGFAPTPMQEFLIIAAKVLGGKALIAMQMSAGINNVLAQLKTTDLPSNRQQQVRQEHSIIQEDPIIQEVQVVQEQPTKRKEEINTPIMEWSDDLLDEGADAVGNPAIDEQLTNIE
jgi:hypothetical protein